MKNVFLFLLTVIFCSSCKENNTLFFKKSEINKTIQMPKDFSFEVNYFTDSYNSKTKEFKRSYQNESKTIKVELTNNELKDIYELFKTNNFENLPNNFENENIMTQPTVSVTLKLNENNKTTSKTFTIGVGETATSKGKNFENISDKIYSILEKKQYVKELKPSNIYLE